MEYLKILEVLMLVFVLQTSIRLVVSRPTVNYLNLTNDTSTAVDMQDNVIVVSIKNVPSMVCGSVDGKTGQFRLTALCHGKDGERENGCRPAQEVDGRAEKAEDSVKVAEEKKEEKVAEEQAEVAGREEQEKEKEVQVPRDISSESERTGVEGGKEEHDKQSKGLGSAGDAEKPCKHTEQRAEKTEGDSQKIPKEKAEEKPVEKRTEKSNNISEETLEVNPSENSAEIPEVQPDEKSESTAALIENHVNSEITEYKTTDPDPVSKEPSVATSAADNSTSADTKSPETTDSAPDEAIPDDIPKSKDTIDPVNQPASKPDAENTTVAVAEPISTAGTTKTKSNSPDPDAETIAAETIVVPVVVAHPEQVRSSAVPVIIEESYAASDEDLWGPGSEPV